MLLASVFRIDLRQQEFCKNQLRISSKGKWEFEINSILADGNQIVTDVLVSDESIQARVISFFTIKNDLIQKIVEF